MRFTQEHSPVPDRLGPYVLGRHLGGGGMGDVFEASHVLMNSRRVAIKLLKPHLADSHQFRQRFLREISALGGVKPHPNLVRAEFADLADDVPFLVMEYVEGNDVDQLLKRQGPLSVADSCNIICQAARGLQAIHEAGLVHRDMKPSNLMVTTDGVVKILDLGLARLQWAEGASDELTSAHCVLGTMDYTSPEQAEDPRKVDIRADIYSLGCTVYKLLTGRAPYSEFSTVAQKIRAHASVPFPGLPAEAPVDLQQAVAKMVAKDPADRFACPDEVVSALLPFCVGSTFKPVMTIEKGTRLEEATRDTPVTVERPTIAASEAPAPATAPRRWSGRIRMGVIAGGLSLVTLLALVIAFRPGQPEDPLALRDVDDWAPLKRHVLFDRKPVPLVQQAADGDLTSTFDADRKTLTVTGGLVALFGLGTVQRPDYRLQVTIKVPSMQNAGLFFGYRTDDPALEPEEKASFQFIAFEMPKPGEYHLKRGKGFVKKKPRPNESLRVESFAVADVLNPRDEMVLEIGVRDHGLAFVKLDNVPCDELTRFAVTEQLKAADHRGAFGVLTGGFGCQFRDATLYLPAPAK